MWDAQALAETMVRAAFPPGVISLVASLSDDQLWDINTSAGTMIGRVVRVELDKPLWASEAYGVEFTLGLMPSADVAPAGKNAHGSFVQALPDAMQDAKSWSERTAASLREQPGQSSSDDVEKRIRAMVPSDHAKYKAIPTTPAAEFDLALIVPDDVMAAKVQNVVQEAGGDLLESVRLFDEFRGGDVPAGFRSLAWHLTFRHPERTLKEKEIEGRRMALLDKLNKELGIKPRAS
jgi:phenylalanyl-tRNA synthetase beta chain